MEKERPWTKIDAIMIKRDITNSYASKMSGVNPCCIANIRKGGHEPRLSKLASLCEVLDIDIRDIVMDYI